jgi:hypothetical protein
MPCRVGLDIHAAHSLRLQQRRHCLPMPSHPGMLTPRSTRPLQTLTCAQSERHLWHQRACAGAAVRICTPGGLLLSYDNPTPTQNRQHSSRRAASAGAGMSQQRAPAASPAARPQTRGCSAASRPPATPAARRPRRPARRRPPRRARRGRGQGQGARAAHTRLRARRRASAGWARGRRRG